MIEATHNALGTLLLTCQDAPELLFTENETNAQRLWGVPNRGPYVKDGINDAVVNGAAGTTNPAHVGTKAAAHYLLDITPGATQTLLLRLSATPGADPLGDAMAHQRVGSPVEFLQPHAAV